MKIAAAIFKNFSEQPRRAFGGRGGPSADAACGSAVNAGGVCAKCQLMRAHIREITGRG